AWAQTVRRSEFETSSNGPHRTSDPEPPGVRAGDLAGGTGSGAGGSGPGRWLRSGRWLGSGRGSGPGRGWVRPVAQ
ncbi:hypothetical protein Dimus_015807, partial [Dionaea muscipula]